MDTSLSTKQVDFPHTPMAQSFAAEESAPQPLSIAGKEESPQRLEGHGILSSNIPSRKGGSPGTGFHSPEVSTTRHCGSQSPSQVKASSDTRRRFGGEEWWGAQVGPPDKPAEQLAESFLHAETRKHGTEVKSPLKGRRAFGDGQWWGAQERSPSPKQGETQLGPGAPRRQQAELEVSGSNERRRFGGGQSWCDTSPVQIENRRSPSPPSTRVSPLLLTKSPERAHSPESCVSATFVDRRSLLWDAVGDDLVD